MKWGIGMGLHTYAYLQNTLRMRINNVLRNGMNMELFYFPGGRYRWFFSLGLLWLEIANANGQQGRSVHKDLCHSSML